ncbi:membrane protein [Streptococcus dysgalactiae]|uniref:membrane protein n=1 Tax=Streptococcus dysgalactiae TaxID=1334 RepID=UPI000617C427|nr:membrane protein [Streptococcus dysgalactiae]KKC22032.1 membrane protein [Streptococcus dysgalactiae subsp. equisimilis]
MTYSFIDILQVTLVSLFLVLTCLTGIMGLMMLSGKLLSQEKKSLSQQASSIPQEQEADKLSGEALETLLAKDELARIAVMTSLAYASQEESGKQFEVIAVERKS